jgi:hypothetical protein
MRRGPITHLCCTYEIQTSPCDGQMKVTIASILPKHFLPSPHSQREWSTDILFSTYTFHTELKFRLLACFVANPCVHRPSPSLVCPVTLQLNSEEHLPVYKPFSPVHIPEKHSKRCFRLTITFWALLLVNRFTLLFALHVLSVRMTIYPSRQAFNCASATRLQNPRMLTGQLYYLLFWSYRRVKVVIRYSVGIIRQHNYYNLLVSLFVSSYMFRPLTWPSSGYLRGCYLLYYYTM